MTAYIGLRSGGVVTVSREQGPREIREPGFARSHGLLVDARQVTVSDIAFGLARTDRFGGQTPRGISVAEHSNNGCRVLAGLGKHTAARQFLLHDVAECLGIGDVHFKLKGMFARDLREKVEPAVTRAVASLFGVAYPFEPDVHALDQAVGHYECMVLHPAADKLLALYDTTRDAVKAGMAGWGEGYVYSRLAAAPYPQKIEADVWISNFWETEA